MDRAAWTRYLQARFWARGLTKTDYLVALAIHHFTNWRGTCFPSLAAIAERAGCCVRSVSRAIVRLACAGLLKWERRWRLWNRCESNRYQLTLPEPSRAPAPAPAPAREAPIVEKERKGGSVATLSNGSRRTVRQHVAAGLSRFQQAVAALGSHPSEQEIRLLIEAHSSSGRIE